jgi:hypothetical protein
LPPVEGENCLIGGIFIVFIFIQMYKLYNILRFDITNDAGGRHKGTILIEQLEKKERGVWYYNISLAQTDEGLILVESDEPGGGYILKLP